MISETKALNLRRALGEIAEEGVPEGLDLWPRVRAAAHPPRRAASLRKAWAGVAVAAIAVMSIAAVTVGPRMIDELDSLLFANTGIDAEFGDPVEIRHEQKIGDVTVETLTARVTEMQVVDGVVEDGQLALEYVVYGLPPRTQEGLDIVDGMPVLLDGRDPSAGEFIPLVGIGTDATSDVFDEQLPEGAMKGVVAFDMHGATVIDGELLLRVEVPLIQFVSAEGDVPLIERDDEGNVTALAGKAYESVEIGRFTFEVTLPVTVVPGDGERDYVAPWKLAPTPQGEPIAPAP